MEAIDGMELSGVGVPSLILRDLSEFSTLPFIAAFDAPEPDERKHRSADQDVEYWEDVG